jgi:hypothetical protein
MLCKVCGRPLFGGLNSGWFQMEWLADNMKTIISEIVCWTCNYWTFTGKVYDRR